MRKIVPHLWYDKEAEEAAALYRSAFDGGSIKGRTDLSGTPSGEVRILNLELPSLDLMLMSAGPYFTFNPSVSFLVACEGKDEVDELARRLGASGGELMPLGEYPFSERYAWITDRFGLSWQIMHMGRMKAPQRITPTQMFVGAQCGRAEEALALYTGVFRNSSILETTRYGPGEGPDAAGTIKHAGFVLEGQGFALMDSAYAHDFAFNEAISYVVLCDTQEEIDYYWAALSADPAAEQCGWIKDKFGFSWQIVPRGMEEFFRSADSAAAERATKAMLGMKKLSIADLRSARGA